MSLKQIAAQMKTFAIANPRRIDAGSIEPYQFVLSGGLTITYFFWPSANEWRLSLSRRDTRPSETEINTVIRDFNIPEEARREWKEFGGYQIIRFIWPATEETRQLELIPRC